MCSPKTKGLDEQTLKKLSCFKGVILEEDVLQKFSMERLPPVTNKTAKFYRLIKETEYEYVSLYKFRGILTYILEMSEYNIFMPGQDCRKLGKIADKFLLENRREPVNARYKKKEAI